MSVAPLLAIRGAHKTFRSGLLMSEPETTALCGVDLHLRPGEVVGLIGESGSGKTTLARAALGLVELDRGVIELDGQAVRPRRWLGGGVAPAVAQMLYQNPSAHIHPDIPIGALIQESMECHKRTGQAFASVDAALAQVGLGGRGGARLEELSGGERRRVGIARMRCAAPRILIADEPTAGLDAALRADIADLLLSSRPPGGAMLLISHDISLVGYACDRIVVMHRGLVVDRFQVADMDETDLAPYTQRLLAASGRIPAPDPSSNPPQTGVAGGAP